MYCNFYVTSTSRKKPVIFFQYIFRYSTGLFHGNLTLKRKILTLYAKNVVKTDVESQFVSARFFIVLFLTPNS